MTTRRAFTLVEVMIALVVTALVVSLAYGAAQAGFDTGDRVATARAGVETEAAARSMIADAIRHALPGIRGGPPVFELTQTRSAEGVPSHALRFLTRGIVTPAGTSGPWEMTIAPGAHGVSVHVRPLEGDTAPIDGDVPGWSAIDVRVLSRDLREAWLDSWTDVERSPIAVSIAFVDRNGSRTGAALVARVGLEGNP